MVVDTFLAPSFSGIRVVGDVHGEVDAFAEAIDGAGAKGLFVVQLGDLVDRGPDSAGALRLALDLVARGDGVTLRGNHDDTLFRALSGNPVRVTARLDRTLTQIKAAPGNLANAFLAHFQAAPWWLRYGDHVLVHGAFHPAMLDAAAPDQVHPRRAADKCRWLALYGEGRLNDAAENLPVRTYRWIDTVPAGVTVLIGHDALSAETIVARNGVQGGRVLFCDTGCGKGGRLSWVDVEKGDL